MVNSDKGFVEAAAKKAQEKRQEYTQLLHEQKRIALRLEKCKNYLENLNNILGHEGLEKIALKESSQQSGIGKPGNRAPDMPVRKPEWATMSLADAASMILSESSEALHVDVIATKIYELESPFDKKKAKRSLVSTLRSGKKRGLWLGLGKNRYQRKEPQAALQLS